MEYTLSSNNLLLLFILSELFTPTFAGGLSLEFESPQVTRTLLSILANLSNAVVWIILARSPISNTSSPLI